LHFQYCYIQNESNITEKKNSLTSSLIGNIRLYLKKEPRFSHANSLSRNMISFILFRCILLSCSTRLGSALRPIGLTGNIACGKTTVANILRNPSGRGLSDEFGIVDVDKIGHVVISPGEEGYKKILREFENEDIFSDTADALNMSKKTIDRHKLGSIIFGNDKKCKRLNSIMHPLIFKHMLERILQLFLQRKLVIVDVPLLFESNWKFQSIFGLKVVVACTSILQLQRLKVRNPNLSELQCYQRINSQMPLVEKVLKADIVIWNSGSKNELLLEVEKARLKILKIYRYNTGYLLSNGIILVVFFVIISFIYDFVLLFYNYQ